MTPQGEAVEKHNHQERGKKKKIHRRSFVVVLHFCVDVASSKFGGYQIAVLSFSHAYLRSISQN